MTGESITTRTATVWMREDGIIQAKIRQDIRGTLEDAKENIVAVAKVNGGKPVPVLVDIRGGVGLDRDARGYYSSEKALVAHIALGLLVDSPITRMTANFFISIDRPPVPTRMFTSEDEAVAWLKTYLAVKTAGAA